MPFSRRFDLSDFLHRSIESSSAHFPRVLMGAHRPVMTHFYLEPSTDGSGRGTCYEASTDKCTEEKGD